MADKLSTHTYDGKLHAGRDLIRADLARARAASPDAKQQAFAMLRAALACEPAATPHTLKFFDIICAAGSAPANHDASNDLWAVDILFLCHELHLADQGSPDPSSVLQGLAEQLHDMSTGQCPPGRTTRLFQVYVSVRGV
uniref:Uncharacterized protein n=1 Tax=Marseillevirus LCMAC103 TaxID=2506604 RepID=A0A481YUD4_9VIRU|nr:MAG: uncharacterized protein LCMAC103_02510 [Marseillevirus LCMAC103]